MGKRDSKTLVGLPLVHPSCTKHLLMGKVQNLIAIWVIWLDGPWGGGGVFTSFLELSERCSRKSVTRLITRKDS